MKKLFTILLLCALSASAFAQSFNAFPLKKLGNLDLLGANNQYFVFEVGYINVLLVNRNDFKDQKVVKFEGIKSFYTSNRIVNNDDLLTYTKEYKTYTKDGSEKNYVYKVNVTKYNLLTGEERLTQSFELIDTGYVSLECKVDTANKVFIVYKKDSVFKTYDYELKEVSNENRLKKFENQNFVADYKLGEALKKLLKNLSFEFDFAEMNISKSSDLSTFKDYNIRFNKIKDESINHFKRSIKNIRVFSKSNKDSFELDFPVDKTIVEVTYKLNSKGHLIIYGKCFTESSGSYSYELFTCIVNQKIQLEAGLKFNDLLTINYNTEKYPYRKYVGLVYTDLTEPDFQFKVNSNKIYVMTYRVRYSNFQDHIYIVKLHDNGEIIINQVTSFLKNDKVYSNNMYYAFAIKDKITILFYDNIKNFNNAVYSDKTYEITSLKDKGTLLVSTVYNPLTDEFSDKKKVADKSTIKNNLNLGEAEMYYDSNNKSWYFFIESMDKKLNAKEMYIFNYTN